MSDLNLDHWLHDLQSEQAFIDKEALVSIFETRVSELLADNPDLLFSFLYRLDVDELKIQSALHLDKDIARALATLIVDRQKLRLDTKLKFRQEGKDQEEQPSFDPKDY